MKYPTTEEIEQLTPEERLQLIADVWYTLEKDTESLPFPAEHERILEQRLQELDSDPKNTLSWDEVERRLQKD